MNIIKKLTIVFLVCITAGVVSATANTQDVQVFSTNNKDGKITSKSIQKVFEDIGFTIDGNNNMNAPFKKRFKTTYYKLYRLMFVHNAKLTSELLKKYPKAGLISPLSTSIYAKNNKIYISTFTLEGMSRMSGVPVTNKVLKDIYNLLNKAIKVALPNGSFVKTNYKNTIKNRSLATHFTTVLELEDKQTLEDAKESFQEELEGELEPVGFIIAGFVNLNDELKANGINDYDFYDVYSICKLEVIFPVSKLYPEAGAFAPCSMYMYKKKSEKITHISFPSVNNWIRSIDIKDKKSIKALNDAQKLLESTIKETTGE